MTLEGDLVEPAENAGSIDYDEGPDRSLVDDVEALIEDGKTYLQAELAFQKSRATFVAGSVRTVVALGAVAALFALLALVGLTVGLIIALTPLITAWGATAVVVGVMLVVAFLCVRSAGRKWSAMMAAASGSASA